MVTGLLSAIGLFIATNIDDIIVLSLFFARGAGQKGTTLRILAGQSGDRRAAVHPERIECAQIGLNARPPAGVAPGNRKRGGIQLVVFRIIFGHDLFSAD